MIFRIILAIVSFIALVCAAIMLMQDGLVLNGGVDMLFIAYYLAFIAYYQSIPKPEIGGRK